MVSARTVLRTQQLYGSSKQLGGVDTELTCERCQPDVWWDVVGTMTGPFRLPESMQRERAAILSPIGQERENQRVICQTPGRPSWQQGAAGKL